MTATTAIGIDIGGTGIKGAVVDLITGALLTDRVKLPTPKGGRPQDIVETTRALLSTVSKGVGDLPVGDRTAGVLDRCRRGSRAVGTGRGGQGLAGVRHAGALGCRPAPGEGAVAAAAL